MPEPDSPPPESPIDDADDPVLQMWGVGKELWEPEGGDAYIARERAEFHAAMERLIDREPAGRKGKSAPPPLTGKKR